MSVYVYIYILYTYNVATPKNGDEQSYYHPPNKIDPENHYFLEECSLATPNLAGSAVGLVGGQLLIQTTFLHKKILLL